MTYKEIITQLRRDGFSKEADALEKLEGKPKVRIGDPLWWVCLPEDADLEGELGVHTNGSVTNIAWNGKEFGTFEDGDFVPFGSQFAFLSRKEAEEWYWEQMSKQLEDKRYDIGVELNSRLWQFSMWHGGGRITWGSPEGLAPKYYLYCKNGEWEIGSNSGRKIPGTVYFVNESIAVEAIEAVVKPFLAEFPNFDWRRM